MHKLKALALAACVSLTPACGWIEELRDRHDEGGGHIEPRCQDPTGIPVVDQGAASRRPDPPGSTPSSAAAAPGGQAQPQAASQGSGQATVREYIRKLMDETRIVPGTAAKPGGPRGGPGSFAKLSSAQVDEFVAAIIYGAARYLPKSLTDEQRWALVCAEISIESAFRPDVASPNPANNSLMSVNPLQLTLGIWDDIFRKYAPGEGLVHYDGSPWDPKQTQNSALEHSIWDGIVASLWCITEQGRRGCPDWFGGPDGPCPKTMHTAFLSWVIGGPALKSGGDLAGQRDAYIASIQTDLKLLGFDVSLIETAF